MRAFALLLLVTITACGESPPPPLNDPTMQGQGQGPLAGLESAPFLNEVWIGEDGTPVPVLYYARENVRFSANCRQASGQFVCAAVNYLRNGTPVEIAKRAIDGRVSAGTKVCMRMNQPLVGVRNSVGGEDSFCRFPDGSLLSTAALEQYKLRVIP